MRQRGQPEGPNVPGNVGKIKILKKLKPKHLSKANRHVRITREIEIDLQRVAKNPEPGIGRGKLAGRQGKNLVGGQGGKVVPTPLFLVDVNSDLLSAGKLRLVQDVLTGLQNGTIGTGVNP